MKLIPASVLFVFLAIGSAITDVAALPSAEPGMPDFLRCRYRGMLNEGPDSTGALARDSNSGDASSTTAGTRVALKF